MLLSKLLKGLDYEAVMPAGKNPEIDFVTDDSRLVKKNTLFIAVPGLTVDGHKFIKNAVKGSAAALVGEKDPKKSWHKKTVYVKVKNSREALSIIAANHYKNPAKKLKIIGVTGTDGKTTTASLIAHILNKSGRKTGLVTTVSAKIGDVEIETGPHVTSPHPLVLQKYLKLMLENSCEYAVIEVTSIGIDQKRVWGVPFDISVFTNLTHEHLLYHKTFDSYAKSKAWLINNSKTSFVNKKYFDLIKDHILKNKKVIAFGHQSLPESILKAIKKRFPEDYNQENALGAALVALECGIKKTEIQKAFTSFVSPPGRLEEIRNNLGIKIFIDFAHTPKALECVLRNLRKKKKGGLIAVFGAASERDDDKRPLMGKISTRLADTSVFTAEDPRYEEPISIIKQIKKGLTNKNYVVEPDRGKAIWLAINKLAKKGDTVVLCGKGHEKTMNYKGVEYPWSDKEAVLEAIKGRRKSISFFENRNVAILGLGVEGKDVAKFLKSKGAKITVLDQKSKKDLDLSDINIKKIKFQTGKNYLKNLDKFNVIIRSPGVYRFSKELAKAEKKGVEITSALKIFLDLCPGKVIGVTGTKGKGTTSTLIYKILKDSGHDAYLVGNIGVPYLEILDKLSKDSLVVMELSSFQLIDITKSPHIAVVLNISEDHLDWHKDKKEYIESKKNIVKYLTPGSFAVINADHSLTRSFAKETRGEVHFFTKSQTQRTLNTKKLLLRGEHNWENIAAALKVAEILKIKKAIAQKAVYSFKGLEHRLELVATKKLVTFYNDSFSTNPEPAIAAVKSFNEPLTIILGGFDKGLDYTKLGKCLSERENVKAAVLIGDTAEKIQKSLIKAGFKGKVLNLGKPKMSKIVKKAFELTPAGGIVVLSPASASFDMFKDYKERGALFKKEVKGL